MWFPVSAFEVGDSWCAFFTGSWNHPGRPSPDAMRWASPHQPTTRVLPATCRVRDNNLLSSSLVGTHAPDAHARAFRPADYILSSHVFCVLPAMSAREREYERIWIFFAFFVFFWSRFLCVVQSSSCLGGGVRASCFAWAFEFRQVNRQIVLGRKTG